MSNRTNLTRWQLIKTSSGWWGYAQFDGAAVLVSRDKQETVAFIEELRSGSRKHMPLCAPEGRISSLHTSAVRDDDTDYNTPERDDDTAEDIEP